jgi:hypothetical protein
MGRTTQYWGDHPSIAIYYTSGLVTCFAVPLNTPSSLTLYSTNFTILSGSVSGTNRLIFCDLGISLDSFSSPARRCFYRIEVIVKLYSISTLVINLVSTVNPV